MNTSNCEKDGNFFLKWQWLLAKDQYHYSPIEFVSFVSHCSDFVAKVPIGGKKIYDFCCQLQCFGKVAGKIPLAAKFCILFETSVVKDFSAI